MPGERERGIWKESREGKNSTRRRSWINNRSYRLDKSRLSFLQRLQDDRPYLRVTEQAVEDDVNGALLRFESLGGFDRDDWATGDGEGSRPASAKRVLDPADVGAVAKRRCWECVALKGAPWLLDCPSKRFVVFSMPRSAHTEANRAGNAPSGTGLSGCSRCARRLAAASTSPSTQAGSSMR